MELTFPRCQGIYAYALYLPGQAQGMPQSLDLGHLELLKLLQIHAPMSDTPQIPKNPSNLPELLDNNEKWAKAVKASYPDFFLYTAALDPQEPKILWIGCSDSRVPESTIFAAMPGAIFSTRNIANQVPLHDDNTLSVITFAVRNLGVEHIVVAGHTGCGGVVTCYKAAKEAFDKGHTKPTIPVESPVDKWLMPLAQHALDGLWENDSATPYSSDKRSPEEELARQNVQLGVSHVLRSEAVRREWATENPRLKAVHGVIYDMGEGLVEDLKITVTADDFAQPIWE